jgi:site-specific recombinase XerC
LERVDVIANIPIQRVFEYVGQVAGLRIHECFRIDTATAEKALRDNEITIKGKGGKIRSVPIQETIEIELKKMLAVTPRGHKLFIPDGVPTDRTIHHLDISHGWSHSHG